MCICYINKGGCVVWFLHFPITWFSEKDISMHINYSFLRCKTIYSNKDLNVQVLKCLLLDTTFVCSNNHLGVVYCYTKRRQPLILFWYHRRFCPCFCLSAQTQSYMELVALSTQIFFSIFNHALRSIKSVCSINVTTCMNLWKASHWNQSCLYQILYPINGLIIMILSKF